MRNVLYKITKKYLKSSKPTGSSIYFKKASNTFSLCNETIQSFNDNFGLEIVHGNFHSKFADIRTVATIRSCELSPYQVVPNGAATKSCFSTETKKP